MRNLETSDLFKAGRLMLKIGVREELQEVAKRAEESKAKKIKLDFGFDLLFGIFEKAMQENAEKEIYIFIADLFECEWEEVKKMNPIEMLKKLEEVANIEEWKNFFGCVLKSIKKN